MRSIGAPGTVQCEGLAYGHTALLPTLVAAVATKNVTTTAQWFVTIGCTTTIGTVTAQQASIAWV